MNAVVQPVLAGLDLPAVQTPAPDDLARFAVNGRLVHAATIRQRPGPRLCIEALVQQQAEHHPRALRVLCRYQVAEEGSFELMHQAATRIVAHLGAGAEVMAVGRGLEIRQHLGEDVFSFIHCDGIGNIAAAGRAST